MSEARELYGLAWDGMEIGARFIHAKQTLHRSSFDDMVWIMDNGYDKVCLDFNTVAGIPAGCCRDRYICLLKIYTVSLLDDGREMGGVVKEIRYLIRTGNQTGGFQHNFPSAVTENQKDILEDFLEELEDEADIDMDKIDRITCIENPGGQDNRRSLNDVFDDYYVLDDALRVFWRENQLKETDSLKEKEEKIKKMVMYGPLYLYWRICTVLPARPQGFCRAPKDFVRRDETGQYYLMMAASSIKGKGRIVTNTSGDYPVYCWATIEEVAREIMQYQELVKDSYNETTDDYFFNTITYARLFNRKMVNPIFKRKHLQARLDMFVREELVKRRHYTMRDTRQTEVILNLESRQIGRFRVGDLRHLSIITMIFLHIDPSVIMLLCGHESIETSCHYYNTDNLTNSYLSFIQRMEDQDDSLVRYRNIFASDSKTRRIVDGGFCHCPDEKRGKMCAMFLKGRHVNCDYFEVYNRNQLDQIIQATDKNLGTAAARFVELFGRRYNDAILETIARMQQMLTLEVKYRRYYTAICQKG